MGGFSDAYDCRMAHTTLPPEPPEPADVVPFPGPEQPLDLGPLAELLLRTAERQAAAVAPVPTDCPSA
jgi:hypothetical protein